VWRFYGARRGQAGDCGPNPAHHALAGLEKRLGERMLLVTQNVDGLHRRAGSERLVEIHGNLFRSKCTQIGCDGYMVPWDDPKNHEPELPACPHCGALARPDIVWFGELLNRANLKKVEAAVQSCTVFLAVGTSGAVYPAAGLAHAAHSAGARTILVNKDPAENIGEFDEFVQGLAGAILPQMLGI
jgi:NAD-dependent deacetylase